MPLTPAQLSLIEASILRNPYIPADIVPTIKQARLLTSTEDEVLYGGSVRGGKTEGLLMAACQFKQQEDSHTLIVRRNRASLTNAGAIISRSHTYLASTDAKWNGSTFKWTFPSKSTITFGYLDDQKAVEQYLSAAYTDIFFEEITDIPKQLFAQLVSRASKRIGNPLPLRVFATCNPPADASGDWIREHWIRFLDADGVAKSDIFDVVDDESGMTTTRRFIRAGLDDNPHEDKVAYLRRLQSVDRLTRARMLGSWTQAREGKMLLAEDLQLTDTPQYGQYVTRCRFWDLAATRPTSKNPDPDYTVGVLMSIDTEHGSFCVEDVVYMRDSPAAVKRLILDTARRDGVDTLVRWWRDPAQAGKAQSHDLAVMMTSFDAGGVLARNNKTTNFSPFAAAAGNGLVSVLQADWTDKYTGSLLSFPTRGVHDDDVDATSGAYGVLAPMNRVTIQASGSYMPNVSDNAEDELRRMRGLPTDTW